MSEERRKRMSKDCYCQSCFRNGQYFVIYFLTKFESAINKEKVLSIQTIIATLTLSMWIIWVSLTSNNTVQLKVGLYNYIPDLQNDGLASYKSMIEDGFNCHKYTVNVIVNKTLYSPYGSIRKYLEEDCFDLIEVDAISLLDIKDIIVDIQHVMPMPSDTLQTAKSAVKVGDQVLAYPTLICGFFVIGLSSNTDCSFRNFQDNFEGFKLLMEECRELVTQVPLSYQRLIGGKMNDDEGRRLTSLYLDAYIDVHGPDTIEKAINDALNGIVDAEVCGNLKWFIGQCSNINGPNENKCYWNYTGSYVKDSKNVINDIETRRTMFLFNFLESSTLAKQTVSGHPSLVMSWPLGPYNYMIQFTDAIVVSKKSWERASEDKKNAIRDFLRYFTGTNLRLKIAFGEDLNPPQNRYLLQATHSFYKSTDDPIYQESYHQIKKSVVSPLLTANKRKKIHYILETKCINMK